MLKDEMERTRRQGRTDLPTRPREVRTLPASVRRRGAARVVDTLLPCIVGFCAHLGHAEGHMALGIVALGPAGTFDAGWGGAIGPRLRAAAAQLESGLGFRR